MPGGWVLVGTYHDEDGDLRTVLLTNNGARQHETLGLLALGQAVWPLAQVMYAKPRHPSYSRGTMISDPQASACHVGVTMRILLIALAVALLAGTVAALSLAAAADAWARDGAAVLIAIAAVFIAQAIPGLLRRRARRR